MNYIFNKLPGKIFQLWIERIYAFIVSVFTEKRKLLEKISRLEDELKKYKEKESKTSKNSSKSPSSDPFYKKNNNRNLSGKSKGKRNQGGQKGHKGATLNQVKVPDKKIICSIKNCKCGHNFSGAKLNLERRQVFDIKYGKIYVIEYVIEKCECPNCGSICKGKAPSEVNSPVQYGRNIQCIGVYFACYQMIPYLRVSEIFEDIFGHYVSPATIYKWVKDCHGKLSDYEKKIIKLLILCRVLHVDETMINVNGSGIWLLSYSTQNISYFIPSLKKDKDAMDGVGILPNFTGFLVHDNYSVYFQYNCFHILCNAHHLRDLNFVYEIQKQNWGLAMILLLIKIKKSVEKAKEEGRNSLEELEIQTYELEYKEILEKAEKDNPHAKRKENQRGKVKQTKSRNLLDRFLKHSNSILAFMKNFTVPFDNNIVERDQRMMKTHQKISGCFRTKEGADYYACCRGYISTLKKNKQNVLNGIALAFSNKPFIPNDA